MNISDIEILVIDAGSTDKTRDIAKQYGAIVIDNNKKLPEIAKHIGFQYATAKYGIFIDSDESFTNLDSLQKRVLFMEKYKLTNLVSTGMISKEREKGIVRFSNYFADPFSHFVYQFNGNNRIEDLTKQYAYEKLEEGYIVKVSKNERIPLFDAAGNVFEMNFARKYYEKAQNKANFVANIFSNTVCESNRFGIMEDDKILHDNRLTVRTYLKKLKWRVKNNVFIEKNEGVGFSARKGNSNRKYLYILYCILIVPVVSESVVLAIKHHDIYFLMNIIFSEYVLLLIAFYMALKVLHITDGKNKTYAK